MFMAFMSSGKDMHHSWKLAQSYQEMLVECMNNEQGAVRQE